jgi:hypothetical protein
VGNEDKEDWMGGACSMHETNKKYKTVIGIAEEKRPLGRNRLM